MWRGTWQPCGSQATAWRLRIKGLAEGTLAVQEGEKALYMGGAMAHMHASEKRPMHSGARGGGILIA